MSRQDRFGVRSGLFELTLGCLLVGSVAVASPAQAGPPAAADGSKLAGAMAGRPYTLNVAKVSAKKGEPVTTQIVITPAAGYHLNTDFPTALKLSPPAGVTAAKVDYKKADATLSEKTGSFAVTLTATQAGKRQVPGELRFAVCTDTTCDPQKSPVTIELEVK